MRMYTMPPDSTEKEKIFGGIFTFAQVIQFAVFTVIGVIVALACYGFTNSMILSVLLLIPFVITGIVFAVVKVDGLMLLTYIKLKRRHKKKVKYFVNAGLHTSLEFSVEEED